MTIITQRLFFLHDLSQQGRNTYVVFSTDLDEKLSKRLALKNALQDAIRGNQLHLNYQPQVDQTGQFCGLEALVRWQHPIKGLISPVDFIPIAEETGQIIQLGRWVAMQACQDAQKLLHMNLLQGRMALNLSPLQVHRPEFLQSLQETLEQTGIPPKHLELELTEGILLRNTEVTIDTLKTLHAMGIDTSIDDFGTGYSSFSYLKDLPVERVKIDKVFIDKITNDSRDAAVCKGIINMPGELGIKVVAEGVETREQFELLKSFGCEAFQGYYFAKPMPFDDLVKWILARQKQTGASTD